MTASSVTEYDAIVLGAGPAGLGAALHAARNGARVAVIDHAPTIGGLCVTRTMGDLRYDIGGHIPFVNDTERLTWLGDLLGDRLEWVPRPVCSWRDGHVRPGRYLDQRPTDGSARDALITSFEPAPDADAAEVLSGCMGAPFVAAELQGYLEKIDGVPLARIPGVRPLRLLREQAAPEGFWFPVGGIGVLMQAMADALRAHGGEIHTSTSATRIAITDHGVDAIDIDGPNGPTRLSTQQIIGSAPPGQIARLLDPPLAPDRVPTLAMRAVCVVYLEVERTRLTDYSWVQIDDPRVPAARIFEMTNWSRDMAPAGRTIIGCECYCHPTPDDPVWGLPDADLVARCRAALIDPLGWCDASTSMRPIEVIRLANGYPLPDLTQLEAMNAAPKLLSEIDGIHLARGSAVIDAITHGERAADAALERAR